MLSVQTLAPHSPRDYGDFLTPAPHLSRAELFDRLQSENLHLTGQSGYWKIEKELSAILNIKERINRIRMREPARSWDRLSNPPSTAVNIALSRRPIINPKDYPECVLFIFVRLAEIGHWSRAKSM